MTGGAFEERTVGADDAGQRLDRWLRRHHPGLTQGRIQQLLRKGRIRVDGAKAKADRRLEAGEIVRAPKDLAEAGPAKAKSGPRPLTDAERATARGLVLARFDGLLALGKPAGLAVQGGSKVGLSLDDLLPALVEEGEERPRLVHRLDRETSGVILVALDRRAAQEASEAFSRRGALKLYLALVLGAPAHEAGRIAAPIGEGEGPGGRERMVVDGANAKPAETVYRTLGAAGTRASLLALSPKTGRTHQLRVHCAHMGHPILGDVKYGAEKGALGPEIEDKPHLHAARLVMPWRGRTLDVSAPAKGRMARGLDALGLAADTAALDPDDFTPEDHA